MHSDQESMYDSANGNDTPASQVSQGSNAEGKRSDTLGVRWQAWTKAKIESNTRKNASRLAKLAPNYVKYLCEKQAGFDDWHRENLRLLEEARSTARERDDLNFMLENMAKELTEKHREVRQHQARALQFKKQADEFREILLAETGNQKDKDDIDSRLRNLRQQLIEKNAEVREKEAIALRFKKEADDFRQTFLAQTREQKVRDDEVTQSFLNMRQKALDLVKFEVLRFDQVPTLERNAPGHLKEFYGNGEWASWSHTDRELHVRQKVFEILYRRILDVPCFGIEERSDTQNGMFTSVAQGLRDFEAMVKRNYVSLDLICNWRRATIECLERFRPREPLIDHVAEELLTFLDPIVDDQSRTPLPRDVATSPILNPILNNKFLWLPARLQLMTLDLCRDVFKFTIMMRKAQVEYRCDANLDGVGFPRPNLRFWAEPHAVDGGRSDEAGDNLAYVLFGALTKQSQSQFGILTMLVKAEVVVARRL